MGGTRGKRKLSQKDLDARGSWLAKTKRMDAFDEGMLECPSWIDSEAAPIWNEVMLMVKSLGILSKADSIMVAMLADTLVEYIDAKTEGNSRWISSTRKQIMQLCKELGLTPGSRVGLLIKPKTNGAKDRLINLG